MKEIQEDFSSIEHTFTPEWLFQEARARNSKRVKAYHREKPHLREALRRTGK